MHTTFTRLASFAAARASLRCRKVLLVIVGFGGTSGSSDTGRRAQGQTHPFGSLWVIPTLCGREVESRGWWWDCETGRDFCRVNFETNDEGRRASPEERAACSHGPENCSPGSAVQRKETCSPYRKHQLPTNALGTLSSIKAANSPPLALGSLAASLTREQSMPSLSKLRPCGRASDGTPWKPPPTARDARCAAGITCRAVGRQVEATESGARGSMGARLRRLEALSTSELQRDA